MIGGSIALWILIFGGVDTGWTFYTPFSTMFSNTMVVPAATAVFITGFSSILTGLNFIVTIHTMRAPGMTWFRLPLFVWAHYATSLIMVLGTPVLAIAVALVAVERLFRVGIFDPALGGDPILFQHLFWFYSHPAVYIMVLPGMGVVSEIIPCFSRRPIFGYRFIAFSSIGIAVLGFLVWGHHMFVSGQSMYAGMVFSILSFLVAIPSAIKVFNWTATMYKGSIRLDTPMLYALGFIGLFTMGGLTGLMLASLAIDVHVHDTYFVVAHFHYIMVGGAVMAYLGGIHFWWPKMSGRMYPELLGKLSALTVFVGFNLTFFPQFVLGYLGMPRRYYEYPPEFQVLNVMSTAGASILAVGYVLPLAYLLFSLRRPPDAGPNPWRATGLEWQTDSPPPVHNFDEIPVVTRGPTPILPKEPRVSMEHGDARIALSGRPPHRDDEPILSQQFDDVEQQSEASTLGMWLFLATEVMFFGGLFTAYRGLPHDLAREVALASQHLNVWLGCLNTVVLLGSSLTMALAVRAAQLRAHRELVMCLVLTMVLGTGFLGIKAVEYTQITTSTSSRAVNFQVPEEDRPVVEQERLDSGKMRDVLRPLLLHDGPARHPPDHRHRPGRRDGLSLVAPAGFPAAARRRSRSPGCTGTSSTSSGSSSIPCSI